MTAQPAPIALKIAYIGGGSRAWAHNLMNDLALCPDLCGEVVLYDIDLAAAQLNERLGNWLQDQQGVRSHWHYRAVSSLAEALPGADFVFISIQPGPLEMMAHEIGVAEKHGLFFPVGDTTGVPGLMRGLRSAITYAEFARAIAVHCPKAWVINYSNPMTICTRTLTHVEPSLKVFGCCHEVFSTQDILAELAAERLGLTTKPDRHEVHVNVLGINHFTWIDRATYAGHDLLAMLKEHVLQPGVRRKFTREEVESKHNFFYDGRQIKFELFQRFGILAAAGDRHLAEFVPGFTRSPEELFRWGVIRTPISYRIDRWKKAAAIALDTIDGRTQWKLEPSGEEAVQQIKALCGMGEFVTNINYRNQGQIGNLPLDAVVETNALLSRDSVTPLVAGDLPPGVHAQVIHQVANQEMIVEAALQRNEDLAFHAVFGDPLTNLPIDEAWEMFREIGLPEGWW